MKYNASFHGIPANVSLLGKVGSVSNRFCRLLLRSLTIDRPTRKPEARPAIRWDGLGSQTSYCAIGGRRIKRARGKCTGKTYKGSVHSSVAARRLKVFTTEVAILYCGRLPVEARTTQLARGLEIVQK